MLAFCATCNLVFESSLIAAVPGSKNTTVKNIGIGCPSGHPAKFLDGTFDVDANGVITYTSGPPITMDIIKRLQSLAGSVSIESENPEDFIEQVNQASPGLGDLVKKTSLRQELKGYVDTLIAILTFLLALAGPKSGNIDNSVRNTTIKIYNVAPSPARKTDTDYVDTGTTNPPKCPRKFKKKK